jgi:primosomal protein N' (replication factor Y)
MSHRLAVLVASPAHSSIRGPLSYRSELPLAPGTLVRVPLGRREVLGLVWDAAVDDDAGRLAMEDKPVGAVLEGIAPLAPTWRQLVTFAANYYQRSAGRGGAGRAAAPAARPDRRAAGAPAAPQGPDAT